MPRIVVVAEPENFQDFGVAHQRFEYVNPILQITSTVDDGLIPSCRLFFDAFAVSKPANIGEVRCNQIELFFHLPWSRHKRCVGQDQRDVVFTEHVHKFGIEPGLAAARVSRLRCLRLFPLAQTRRNL